MSLREWLTDVGRAYFKLWRGVLLVVLLCLVLIRLAVDLAPGLLPWVRGGEEAMGQRLRRECESIAREVDDGTWSEGVRDKYIRTCIDRRGRGEP
jgi:hypothetical protein